MKRISLNLFVTLTPAMLIAFGAGSLRDDLEGAFWVIILLQACINVYAYIRGLRKETMLLGAVVLTAFPLLFCREAYRNDAEGAIATVALLSFFIGFVSILIKYCIGNRRQNRTFAADDNHCQSVNVASTVVDNINGKAKLTGVLESDEARGAQVALVRRSDESLPDDYIIVSGGNEAIEEMRTKILTQIRRVVDSASILTYTLSKMPDNPDLKMRISANAKEALSEMMVPLLPKNNYLRFSWPVSHVSRVISGIMDRMRDDVACCDIHRADETVARPFRDEEVNQVLEAVFTSVRDIIDASRSSDNTLTIPGVLAYK